MAATAFYAGFAGGEGYGRDPARSSAGARAARMRTGARRAPAHQLNLPQIRLEPLLEGARRASSRPVASASTTSWSSSSQDEDGVSALVRDRASGESTACAAQYLIGADGGRTVPGLVGIDYEGLGVLSHTATIHATADLSRWAGDEDVLLRWVLSPQAGPAW